jgi:hypothetical protein
MEKFFKKFKHLRNIKIKLKFLEISYFVKNIYFSGFK